MVVYTDTGVGGVAVNDDPTAVAWARERFDRARADAERVTPEAVLDGRRTPDIDAEDAK
ncbi:hypothetical protein ACFQFH_10570 [Halobaculum halobium]|uniref:transcriptional regulator FilR1 domain-containing protein n=1 Tax=Halobaculum halobium TaxID=3032281 RepID=UPI00360794A2